MMETQSVNETVEHFVIVIEKKIAKRKIERERDIDINCNLDESCWLTSLNMLIGLWIACYFSEVSELMSVSATREPYIPRAIFKNHHKLDHVTRDIKYDDIRRIN